MHDMRMLREQIDVLRDGMRRRGVLDAMAPVIDRAEAPRRRSPDPDPGGRRAKGGPQQQRPGSRPAKARRRARPDDLIAGGRALGDEIAKLESELREVEAQLQGILLEIPNVTLPGGSRRVARKPTSSSRRGGHPRRRDCVKPALGHRRAARLDRPRSRVEDQRVRLHRLSRTWRAPDSVDAELLHGHARRASTATRKSGRRSSSRGRR